ncbi:MAG: hypothetical protein JWP36_1810 [Paucimonas sp.]|jgi:hypothetical protein|nr:hypothetical protein [Paucimonas sp.]
MAKSPNQPANRHAWLIRGLGKPIRCRRDRHKALTYKEKR